MALLLFFCFCVALLFLVCRFALPRLSFFLNHVFVMPRRYCCCIVGCVFCINMEDGIFVFCCLILNGTVGDLFVAYLSCCVVGTFVAQPTEEFLRLFLFMLRHSRFVARCLGIFCLLEMAF